MCFGWGVPREIMLLYDGSGSMNASMHYPAAFSEFLFGYGEPTNQWPPEDYDGSFDPDFPPVYEMPSIDPKAADLLIEWCLAQDPPRDPEKYLDGLLSHTCKCGATGARAYWEAMQISGMPLRTSDELIGVGLPSLGHLPLEGIPPWFGTENPWTAMLGCAFAWDKEGEITVYDDVIYGEGEDPPERPEHLDEDIEWPREWFKINGLEGGYHKPNDPSAPPRIILLVADELAEEPQAWVDAAVRILREKRVRVIGFHVPNESKTGDDRLRDVCERTGGVYIGPVPGESSTEDGEIPNALTYYPEGWPIPEESEEPFPFDYPVRTYSYYINPEFGDEEIPEPNTLDFFPDWYREVIPFQVRLMDYVRGFDLLDYGEPAPPWETEEEGE